MVRRCSSPPHPRAIQTRYASASPASARSMIPAQRAGRALAADAGLEQGEFRCIGVLTTTNGRIPNAFVNGRVTGLVRITATTARTIVETEPRRGTSAGMGGLDAVFRDLLTAFRLDDPN